MDELMTRAVEMLRRPVPVRAQWREELLRQIDVAPAPMVQIALQSPKRSWSVRPASAIAAAVAILIAGIAAGAFIAGGARRDVAAVPNANLALTSVRFVIVAPTARQVSLVGDFNGWNVAANPMRAASDGKSWILEVPLAPGRHTYAFVVDGDVLRDPSAPSIVDDDFGVRNSVVFVGDGRT
jgi:hypothetical protein